MLHVKLERLALGLRTGTQCRSNRQHCLEHRHQSCMWPVAGRRVSTSKCGRTFSCVIMRQILRACLFPLGSPRTTSPNNQHVLGFRKHPVQQIFIFEWRGVVRVVVVIARGGGKRILSTAYYTL